MTLQSWKEQARKQIFDWYQKNQWRGEPLENIKQFCLTAERNWLSATYFDYIHRVYEAMMHACSTSPEQVRFLHLGSSWSFAALEIKQRYNPLAVTAVDDRGRYYWAARELILQNSSDFQGVDIPQPWTFSFEDNHEHYDYIFITPPFMMENNYHVRSILAFKALQCLKPGGVAIIQVNKNTGHLTTQTLRAVMSCAGFEKIIPLSRAVTPLKEWTTGEVFCILGAEKKSRTSGEIRQALKQAKQDPQNLILQASLSVSTDTPEIRMAAIRQHIANRDTKFTVPPADLLIVTDNRCNLRCVFCNYPDTLTNRKLSEVLLQDVKNSISGLSNILLSGGEPLLQPSTYAFLRYAASHANPTIKMISNMNVCSPRTRDLLVRGLSHLSCSLDAARAETYSALRVNGNFKTATDNLYSLANLRTQSPESRLRLAINFIVTDYNISEIFPFAQLAYNLGMDEVLYKRFVHSYIPRNKLQLQIDYSNDIKVHTVLQDIIKTSIFCRTHGLHVDFGAVPFFFEKNRPDIYQHYSKELFEHTADAACSYTPENTLESMPCMAPFTTLSSYSSNDVFFCCTCRQKYKAIRIDPGQNMLTAFNAPLYQEARQHFYNGDFDKVCPESCALYKRFLDRTKMQKEA